MYSESLEADQYKLIPNKQSCIDEGYIQRTAGAAQYDISIQLRNTVRSTERSSGPVMYSSAFNKAFMYE